MMGLGPCDVVTLAEARDLAKAARKLVTFGRDPIEHRNATEAAEREAYLREQASKMTFGACADAYLAEHLSKFKNAKHQGQWKRALDLASKAFGDLNVGRDRRADGHQVPDADLAQGTGDRLSRPWPDREGARLGEGAPVPRRRNPARWEGSP